MRLFTCVCTLFCVYFIEFDFSHGHSDMAKLLLVSFDGFRWDYLDMVKQKGGFTPNFDRLIKDGVKAEHGTKNVFVTKTFPNHYSLVTGMYEENHGVVGNEIYDPVRNKTVSFTGKNDLHSVDPNDPYWWTNGTESAAGPEPIWITNQKGRDHELFTRNSGVMFWPGSTTKRTGKNMMPYHYMVYNRSLANETRIDNIVNWFSTEDHPINLGLLYFSEPDHLGHQVGPDHPRMVEMIMALDKLVGYLISKLEEHHLYHHLNMIITSDHGMANIDASVYIEKYVNFDELVELCVGHSPGLNIKPKEGKREELMNKLLKIEGINVYTKENIPRDYHYQYNNRILEIVVSGKLGTNVFCKEEERWDQKGNHGYNNSLSEMHPFFIARGPAFKKNFVAEKQFNSVDVYPLMCHILDIEPGPHDGDLENIEFILSDEEDEYSLVTVITSNTESSENQEAPHKYKVLISVLFAATLAGIISVAACRVYRINKHRKRHLTLPLNMVAGKVPLLASDEEEIP